MRLELLREVDSTNDYIKRYLKGGVDVIVCSERQTGGKGTKGRKFSSGIGGVYLSALNFYQNFPASDAFKIMEHAAVSVCKTVEAFGACAEIKWANDVYVGGKKICGILIENILEGNSLKASVVGIGLNVQNDLTGLEEIAVRLADVSAFAVSVEAVRGKLIEEFQKKTDPNEYLGYIKFLGKVISVREGDREELATALEILPDGRLKIKRNGEIRLLSAAEISIKI